MSPAPALKPPERRVALQLVSLLLKKVAMGVVRSEDFAEEFLSLKDELQKDTETDIDKIAEFAAALSLEKLIKLGILDDPDKIEKPEIRRVLISALKIATERMAEADDVEPEEGLHD